MLSAARTIQNYRNVTSLLRFYTRGQNVHRDLFSNFFNLEPDYFTVSNYPTSNVLEQNRIFAFEIKDRIFSFIHYIFVYEPSVGFISL